MNDINHIQELFIENAIKWAKAKLGNREYQGMCLAFVEDAYELSNNIEIFGGDCAKESADIYNAGYINIPPPRGTFVFFDCHGVINGVNRNWGHVGLYLGNNEVIHAWDSVRIDSLPQIEELVPPPGWTKPVYLGWVQIERILSGYRER